MSEPMKELKCNNCGAPLKVRPRDLRKGMAVCPFCDTVFKFDKTGPGDKKTIHINLKDLNLSKGNLWLINKVKDVFGAYDDDPDAPAKRPANSKITIENQPGQRFYAKIDSAGFGFGSCFMAVFTIFWCGFMVTWNLIALWQKAYVMIAFGLIHDVVGVFLFINLTWTAFGSEVLSAYGEMFSREKKLFGFSFKKNYPLTEIDDFVFVTGRQKKFRANRKLYMMVSGKRRRIAGVAFYPDLKWLRQELLRFFKPRW